MIVHTLKMCTGDAGPEQSLVLFKIMVGCFFYLFQPVWFGCDVVKHFNLKNGFLDLNA